MIEPFFFSDRKLFGTYHASSDITSNRLLIICPPFFDEYRRCYRALADLAIACAEKGVHVLRFDYRGTGESFGLLSDVSHVQEWVEDINESIEEGMALTGAENVTLLGIRFGCNIAEKCQHTNVSQLIFWDPLESGSKYLEWLTHVDTWLALCHSKLESYSKSDFGHVRFQQFGLTASLKDSLQALCLDRSALDIRPFSCLISGSEHEEEYDLPNIKSINFDYEWPEYEDGLLRPRVVLEELVRTICNQ